MRRLSALALVAALFLGGCLTPGVVEPPLQYYMDPATPPAETEAVAVTLGVRPFMATRPYQSLPMAYLTPDGVLAYYGKDQWAEMPAALLTRSMTDALARSGRFVDVGDASTLSRPDWQLTGELRKYHERRTAEGHSAVVELRLEMREARERNLLWAATLREETPIDGDGGQALAGAMKASIERLLLQATDAITAVEVPAES